MGHPSCLKGFYFWSNFFFLYILVLIFPVSLAKEEQCVPEVCGRAAAVGNSR